MNDKRRVLFLTGTRADYGKMKSLMCAIEESESFECFIFITGMHTLKEFGDTKSEIIKDNFKNIQIYMNQIIEEPMDLVLANTINGFSRYIRELKPDMIVIHGDRVEALAGAITGAINNILVAHIEGGELSGTIDDSIRHSISKLAHIHFVSNYDAKNRLIQLGEDSESIFVIGSSDIDVIMKRPTIDIEQIKKRYEICFSEYAVLLYHPVTTEIVHIKENTKKIVDAVIKSHENFIVIHPNNDHGYRDILMEYERFKEYQNIKCFPSIRFEFFIEILRNAKYLIGNSSAGIHEAPVIGIPSINIGTRQSNRYKHDTILNCPDDDEEIFKCMKIAEKKKNVCNSSYFGDGNSKANFFNIMTGNNIWKISRQKKFIDII